MSREITPRSAHSYSQQDDGVEMEPSQMTQYEDESPQYMNHKPSAYEERPVQDYENDSIGMSQMQSERPISMVVSGPMSGNRNRDEELIDRSANAATMPLQI